MTITKCFLYSGTVADNHKVSTRLSPIFESWENSGMYTTALSPSSISYLSQAGSVRNRIDRLFQLVPTGSNTKARFQAVNFLLWHPLIASLRWSVRARHHKKWTKHQKTWGKTPGKSLLNSSQIAFLLNCRFVDLYIHRTSYLVLQPRVLSKYSLECAEGSKSIHFQVVEVIGSLSVGLN